MKVAIVGSRLFGDYNLLKAKLNIILFCNNRLDKFGKENTFTIITGDAKLYNYKKKIIKNVSTDLLVKKFANEYNLDCIVLKPINRYVDNAYDLLEYNCYFARNKQIVDNCDFLIVFWNGKSKGTKMTINYAKSVRKKVIEIKV